MFLPAASMFEKNGTFINAERRIQGVRKAFEPPRMRVPIGRSSAPWRSAWDIQKGFATILSKISGTKSGESGRKVRA
ncbi:MAG: molybdopterin-dependent oxidoreductase [Rhizomicrobium sp.]